MYQKNMPQSRTDYSANNGKTRHKRCALSLETHRNIQHSTFIVCDDEYPKVWKVLIDVYNDKPSMFMNKFS